MLRKRAAVRATVVHKSSCKGCVCLVFLDFGDGFWALIQGKNQETRRGPEIHG